MMLNDGVQNLSLWLTSSYLVLPLISDAIILPLQVEHELFARHDRIYFLFIGPHRCPQVYNEKVCLYTFCYRQYCFAGTWLLGVDR